MSARPATRRTSEGVFDQIWMMMIVSPVPVSAMSLTSCHAVCHVIFLVFVWVAGGTAVCQVSAGKASSEGGQLRRAV